MAGACGMGGGDDKFLLHFSLKASKKEPTGPQMG
jgi:hypothetical protein